jgi:hypothetical protein
MKFYYEGKTYRLEFERNYQQVSVRIEGQLQKIRSTYPYTSAKLYETPIGEVPKLVLIRTVGCLPTDKYSNEKGRLFALRGLSRALNKLKYPKGLIAAIWLAYRNRTKPAEEVGVRVISAASNLILLPGLPEATEQVH